MRFKSLWSQNLAGINPRRAWGLSGAVVSLVAVLALAGCGGGSPNTNGSTQEAAQEGGSTASSGEGAKLTEPLIIGAAIAESGAMQPFDEPAYAAFKVKVEELNEEGGVGGQPVKLVVSNTNSTQNGAKQAAEEVIKKGADVVLVTCNFDFAAPAANVASEDGKLNMTLCGGSAKFGPQGIGPLTFNGETPTPLEGSIEAKFADDKGYKKAFILEDTSIDYGQEDAIGFKEGFEQLGGSIIGEAQFLNEDRSIASQVTQIKESGADVILVASYAPGGASAVRQIRAAGIETPIVSNVGLDGTYWISAVPHLNDFCSTGQVSLEQDNPNKEINKLLTRYEETTGAPMVSSLGFTGFIDAELIAAGVEKAGSSESEAIAAAMEEFDEQPTVLGPVTYSAEVHSPTTLPMAVSCYTNGKPKLAESVYPLKGIDLGIGGPTS